MADILIRPTETGDAALLAANLRACDREELQAVGYWDALAPIADSVRTSALCWTALADGELACILGVAPLDDQTGAPWMLGTPLLDTQARVLVRETPRYIGAILEVFPHLLNFVHAQNRTSVHWLRRLGFTLHDAVPYGSQGALFHPFEMRAR